MNSNKPWWESEKEEAHREVIAAANNTRKNQLRIDDLDQRHYRLYAGLPLHTAFVNDTLDAGDVRFTMNVVQSGVNTLVSKISKNKIRPTFLTDDGDWFMQEEAKKLTRYVYGQFYRMKVYEETKQALRDSCIFGDGFVKHWHDSSGKIHVKRVFKPSLMFDLAECMFGGDPKTSYEIRVVSKDSLKKKYPEFAVEIDAAKLADLPFFVDNTEASVDLVAVVEAYHAGHNQIKKKEKGEKGSDKEDFVPGKHFIGISTATFVYEDFKMKKLPYKRIPFSPNALGYLSRGVGELLTGHQVEINRTLKRISRAMNLMSSPHILVDHMSKVVDTHFNNDVGNIVKFSGLPPTYNFPQGISPVVIEWFLTVYQKAFEEIGLSQLTAQSQKPAGLNSGRALREYNDIETERFAELAQNWEQFHLEVAEAILEHSEIIASEGGKPVVLAPEKMGAQEIDFSKIKLKNSEYIMQSYPSSKIPKDPWGRLEFVGELMDRQMIDQSEGLGLMDFPDVESVVENKTAYIDDIKYTAALIVNKAEYIAPEPYQNLQYGIQFMNSTYLKMKTRNLPTDRLDLLQRWINDALALQESMAEGAPMEADPEPMVDMMGAEPAVDEAMMAEEAMPMPEMV